MNMQPAEPTVAQAGRHQMLINRPFSTLTEGEELLLADYCLFKLYGFLSLLISLHASDIKLSLHASEWLTGEQDGPIRKREEGGDSLGV